MPSKHAVDVKPPYRLDLTVDALRRLAANVVDTVDENGVYRRVLADEAGANLIEVSQASPKAPVLVTIGGRDAKRWLPSVERMLGFDAQVDEWYKRVKPFPWLAHLAKELKGLRPPRYPSLFEALAHAIVFQQISIYAAGAIMRRMVEALGTPIEHAGSTLYAFPLPHDVLQAPDEKLRSAGLSANKVMHLRSAAQAILDGAVREDAIAELSTPEAAAALTQVRGIGPWSAAVVLLRGFGRLDIFPMKDSGVARSVKLLSGNPSIDLDALLTALGPVRGMLYFHLLLGRIHGIVPP